MAGSKRAAKGRRSEAEERLLVAAAQRDPSRFADVYENYLELVYAYVARRVPNRAAAEDLTSEVFHKALANLPHFKWRGAPFAAWLFRIASNMIADRAKRAARERNVSLDYSPEAERGGSSRAGKGVDTASGTVRLPPRSARAPQSQQTDLEDSERSAELFRLVDELMEDQRHVVMMRFAEEKSIREIAQALGRSEGAIKQLQFRALENLRARLAKK
jgi:RNA polymerase sigma-70 factor (ECF subfamily)